MPLILIRGPLSLFFVVRRRRRTIFFICRGVGKVKKTNGGDGRPNYQAPIHLFVLWWWNKKKCDSKLRCKQFGNDNVMDPCCRILSVSPTTLTGSDLEWNKMIEKSWYVLYVCHMLRSRKKDGGKNSNSNSKEFLLFWVTRVYLKSFLELVHVLVILVPDCLKLAINVRRMKSGNCIYDSDDSPLLYWPHAQTYNG